MKHKGIRKTKRTANYFTPIVKLIFDGEVREKEKSLVMRCASTLRLADSMGIDSDGIAAFVDEQGGIVQCYKLDRDLQPAAAAKSTTPDPIEALRQNARKCNQTALRQLVPNGPATALSIWTRMATSYCWAHGLLSHLKSAVTRYRRSRRPCEG
jgi:hypothetical protein